MLIQQGASTNLPQKSIYAHVAFMARQYDATAWGRISIGSLDPLVPALDSIARHLLGEFQEHACPSERGVLYDASHPGESAGRC
jgi:hypothetical protein